MSTSAAWWARPEFRLALAFAPPVWLALWLAASPSPRLLWPLQEPWEALRLVALYPLLEEWVFRGNLQPWLGRRLRARWFGITAANLATSLLFMALHLIAHPPVAALSVLLPSLVFGWLRDRLGSFLPAFAVHAWYNLGYFWITSGMR